MATKKAGFPIQFWDAVRGRQTSENVDFETVFETELAEFEISMPARAIR